jgi:hypothetical protein
VAGKDPGDRAGDRREGGPPQPRGTARGGRYLVQGRDDGEPAGPAEADWMKPVCLPPVTSTWEASRFRPEAAVSSLRPWLRPVENQIVPVRWSCQTKVRYRLPPVQAGSHSTALSAVAVHVCVAPPRSEYTTISPRGFSTRGSWLTCRATASLAPSGETAMPSTTSGEPGGSRTSGSLVSDAAGRACRRLAPRGAVTFRY